MRHSSCRRPRATRGRFRPTARLVLVYLPSLPLMPRCCFVRSPSCLWGTLSLARSPPISLLFRSAALSIFFLFSFWFLRYLATSPLPPFRCACTQALTFAEYIMTRPIPPAPADQVVALRLSCLLNRAACELKLGRPKDAETTCTEAIGLSEVWSTLSPLVPGCLFFLRCSPVYRLGRVKDAHFNAVSRREEWREFRTCGAHKHLMSFMLLASSCNVSSGADLSFLWKRWFNVRNCHTV